MAPEHIPCLCFVFFGLNRWSQISMELSPETLITAIAPMPGGVAKAQIVSFGCVVSLVFIIVQLNWIDYNKIKYLFP